MSKEFDDLLRQQDDVVVTLYTEEQVREVLEKAQLLNHNDEFVFTVDYLIQSLKQGGDK